MKSKIIIGIGATGLICSIVGGYYYWVVMQLAMLLAGSHGDNNLNISAWRWFGMLCVGAGLLLTSGVSFFVARRRNRGPSAA